MISFHHVFKTFGKHNVLNDLSFHIPKGKITFILGKSGEGKSVTLKHILGFLKPNAGRIVVDGKDIIALDTNQLRLYRRNFGVLFQNVALFDSMTVKENILLPLNEYFSYSEREKNQIIDELMEKIPLENLLHKHPEQLSLGEKKRAGLARALIIKPKILLYDEPTTGMDPIMCEMIDNLIAKVNKNEKNLTSVVVSHDVKASLTISDNIIMLYDGKLALSGTAKEFRETKNPIIRQFFSGKVAGPMKFI